MSAAHDIAPAPARIGSSDAAAILGLSPWSSPWEAWARLVGLVERYDSGDTAATARGRMLEPAIGYRYAVEHGLTIGVDVWPGPPITAEPLAAPDLPFLAVRPDYLVFAGEKRDVECKSARYLDEEDGWGEPGSDRVPKHYAVQVVVQIAVLVRTHGMERADLAAFGTVADDFRVYTLRRRDRLEGAILARLRDWHERHVLEGNPPPIDGTDACGRVLAKLHPGKAGKVWRDPEPLDRALARDIAALDRQIAELQTRRDQKQHALCERIGDAYGIRDVARWSPTKGRQTVDREALAKAHPEIARQFTRIGEPTRRFALLDTDTDTDPETP